MDRKECFLHNPGVIAAVLKAAITSGLEEAASRNSKHGAMVAAIVLDGKLYLDAQALGGDVTKENDLDIKWEDNPNAGINYVGYAIGKVMQSIRTGTFSNEGKALGYGESDAVGSYCTMCFCIDSNVLFQLLTAYSGMSSEDDFRIAHEACNSG